MTPDQKRLVKETWAKVLPIKQTAAELFYTRLFETSPEVKPYFKGDMHEQGRKLMAMLGTAVNSLDKLESLTELLHRTGAAHTTYGVKTEDYDKVADALLWTLEQGLGDAFTADVKDAWGTAYAAVAGTMIEGAAHVDASASSALASP